MEHLPEFFANNTFLFIAFIVVLMLTIRAEMSHQAGRMNNLSPTQAIRVMNNESAVIIDVSDAADFNNGHIKGAINVPIKELNDKLPELKKYGQKAILTYCKNGNQSVDACKILKRSQFSNVHNISGGLRNWLESNLPVTK